MIATRETQPRLNASTPPPAVLLRMMLDPLMAIATLMACAIAFGVPFQGPYLILAMLTFSLTFPGSAPRATSAISLARDVLGDWLLVVVMLILLGWVTRTLGSVDERVIFAWIGFAPVAIFTGHFLLPRVLPRLLEAEGMQRIAIVAGAGAIGRNLAMRIHASPFLGIKFAGFFDDRAPGRVPNLDSGRILGNLSQLAEYAKKNRVDLIYLALPMASQPRIMKLIDELHDTTASIYFTPDIFLFDMIQARMDTIGGIPVLAV
ncbi:MAG: undecaprenyl-phosphate glucose phosphotransferase, partial [Bacillota bacterium]